MAVLRKHQRHTFTVVDNDVFNDQRISWRATGLLAYLLSLPDDWQIRSKDLATRKTDGVDSVRAAMRELEDLGYLRSVKRQDRRGRWVTTIHVAESPDLLDEIADQPKLEYPAPVPPEPDQPSLGPTEAGNTPPLVKTQDQTLKSDLLPSVVDHRRRDEVWDALEVIFGAPTTESNRALRGRICRSLKGAGATGPEVMRRARAWADHFSGGADLTETALEKHWDRLGRPPLRPDPVARELAEEELRAREREARAVELDRKALSG